MVDQAVVRNRFGLKRKKNKKRMPFWQELPILAVVSIALALLIKTFLIQTFYIPSGSMMNTLQLRDRVLVNKVVYDLRGPRRGEVVVFTGVEWGPEPDYVKRVIGLPGDTVQCCDAKGRVMVNGTPIDEPYIFENTPVGNRTFAPVKVPDGRLWVMGDHRGASGDSRAHMSDQWHGTIPVSGVIGRAFVIVWPVGRVGGLSVPSSLESVGAQARVSPP